MFYLSELPVRDFASLVEELIQGGLIRGDTVAMDATFIKAYSKRDSRDNRRGASDPDAMVGRDGRSYGLGYKAHIAADVDCARARNKIR